MSIGCHKTPCICLEAKPQVEAPSGTQLRTDIAMIINEHWGYCEWMDADQAAKEIVDYLIENDLIRKSGLSP
jgi:hypothetical protein